MNWCFLLFRFLLCIAGEYKPTKVQRREGWPDKNLIYFWLGMHGSDKRLDLLAPRGSTLTANALSAYLRQRPRGPTPQDLRRARALASPEERAPLDRAIRRLAPLFGPLWGQ